MHVAGALPSHSCTEVYAPVFCSHRGLRLRNYVPEDEDLKRRRVPQAKPVAVEEKVKEQLEAAKPEPVIEEVVSPWEAPPCWGCFLL